MLEIKLKASFIGVLATLVAGVLVVLALLFTALPFALKIVIAALSLFTITFICMRDMLLVLSSSIDGLRLHDNTVVLAKNACWLPRLECQRCLKVLPVLVIIYAQQYRPLLIWRDSVRADDWRRLVVHCKFNRYP